MQRSSINTSSPVHSLNIYPTTSSATSKIYLPIDHIVNWSGSSRHHELHGVRRRRRRQDVVAGGGRAERGGSQEGDPQGQARRRHRGAARRLRGDRGLSP